MDADPQHDPVLDLPLCFPGDEPYSPPARHRTRAESWNDTPRNASPDASVSTSVSAAAAHPASPSPSASPSAFTPAALPESHVHVRVADALPGTTILDSNWSADKDEVLWQILSRVTDQDIDWEELARQFDTTVDFLVIHATVLAERQISQVRAQTANALSRHSPLAPYAPPRPSVRRTSSSRPVSVVRVRADTPPTASRRPSLDEARHRVAPTTTSTTTTTTSTRDASPRETTPPVETTPTLPSHQFSRIRSRIASLVTDATRYTSAASPLPRQRPLPAGHPLARPKRQSHNSEDESDYYGGAADPIESEPLSSPAEDSADSDSVSSTPSEPVMSRVFRRPPGFPAPYTDDHTNDSRDSRDSRRARFRALDGLGITAGISAGPDSDDDADADDSETQPAFLPFKAPTLAKSARKSQASRLAKRPPAQIPPRPLSPSSSSSASPTAKTFRHLPGPSSAALPAPRHAVRASSTVAATPTSPAAVARLHPSRLPVVPSPTTRSRTLPPSQSQGHSGRRARSAGYAREDSETGTTPSMGSSFSDLDDVYLTQSVLDEALASNVEDTSSARSDTQSSTMTASASALAPR